MIGLTGGFVGPYVFGLIEQSAGSVRAPFGFIIAAGVAGIVLALVLGGIVRRETTHVPPVPATETTTGRTS